MKVMHPLYALYHSTLRVSVVVVAVLLVFDSGVASTSTKILSAQIQNQMAQAVGIYAGVTPNEVNQLTSRITELEGELAAKERLISVNLAQSNNGSVNPSTILLVAILCILLTLIIINYVLDHKRITLIEQQLSKARKQYS